MASSRRGDRSLEARYQSALMASEVHKNCTDQNLRLTCKIVKDDEMYEKEDQRPPEPWLLSPNGYRGRTSSQTDACITALMARNSGMTHAVEHTHALSKIAPFNSPVWTAQISPTPPCDKWSDPPEHQPTEYEIPSEAMAGLSELGANAALHFGRTSEI